MTPSTNDFQRNDERLTPELSALEARLSELKPRAFPGADETKREGFRVWRGENPRRRREFDAELAETIVQVGERDVAAALRRYLKTARATCFLVGLVFGLAVGAVASLCALQYCVRLVDATRERPTLDANAFPRYSNDFNDLQRFSAALSAKAFSSRPANHFGAPSDSSASVPADSPDPNAAKENEKQ